MNFNKAKWIPAILFLVFVLALIYISFKEKDFFARYSDLISILSTLSFIYLTYETLRQTRQSVTLPHRGVKFIVASRLDDNFTKNYKGLVLEEQVKILLEDFKVGNSTKKDLVFIKVENVGETTAIDVRVDLQYNKQMYGKDVGQNMNIKFGIIKKDETLIRLVDSFEFPTKNDFLKIEKCVTVFNTVSRKDVQDGDKKKDVLETLSYENSDDDVTITFKK